MPCSWNKCRTTAAASMQAITIKQFERHFCANKVMKVVGTKKKKAFCDEPFDEDRSHTMCRTCNGPRFNKKGRRPLRMAVYFDMDDKIERMFRSKYLCQQLEYHRKQVCTVCVRMIIRKFVYVRMFVFTSR